MGRAACLLGGLYLLAKGKIQDIFGHDLKKESKEKRSSEHRKFLPEVNAMGWGREDDVGAPAGPSLLGDMWQ